MYDDDGTITGVRPLGGGVNFAESWRDKLIREFYEELGLQVDVVGDLLSFENIYNHKGVIGHEVAFVAEIRLLDSALTAAGPVFF